MPARRACWTAACEACTYSRPTRAQLRRRCRPQATLIAQMRSYAAYGSYGRGRHSNITLTLRALINSIRKNAFHGHTCTRSGHP